MPPMATESHLNVGAHKSGQNGSLSAVWGSRLPEAQLRPVNGDGRLRLTLVFL